jgi:hypothetical protein
MELSATGLSSQVRGSLLKEKRSEHSHGAEGEDLLAFWCYGIHRSLDRVPNKEMPS